MNVQVDPELCIGCGSCENLCPAVFELVDGRSRVKLHPVPAIHQERALRAEEQCPVSAISHD